MSNVAGVRDRCMPRCSLRSSAPVWPCRARESLQYAPERRRLALATASVYPRCLHPQWVQESFRPPWKSLPQSRRRQVRHSSGQAACPLVLMVAKVRFEGLIPSSVSSTKSIRTAVAAVGCSSSCDRGRCVIRITRSPVPRAAFLSVCRSCKLFLCRCRNASIAAASGLIIVASACFATTSSVLDAICSCSHSCLRASLARTAVSMK